MHNVSLVKWLVSWTGNMRSRVRGAHAFEGLDRRPLTTKFQNSTLTIKTWWSLEGLLGGYLKTSLYSTIYQPPLDPGLPKSKFASAKVWDVYELGVLMFQASNRLGYNIITGVSEVIESNCNMLKDDKRAVSRSSQGDPRILQTRCEIQ